eukprot:6256819-Amphidinium_carterae.1
MEQTLHSTVQDLTTQLAATRTASLLGSQQHVTGTMDTRTLGKPEVFEGNETKWHDFRVVFKAYCFCVNQRFGVLMSGIEAYISGSYVKSTLDPRDVSCSTQLYYILLLLCRQQPLTLVFNAGEQEGLTAWQRLVEQHEPQQRT